MGPAPDRAREGAGVAGSPVPRHGISSGGQQMASSPKLAICPSWITSLTRICHPPAPSGKAFPNELQRGNVYDLYLLGLKTSMKDDTSYTGWTLLLANDGRAISLLYL